MYLEEKFIRIVSFRNTEEDINKKIQVLTKNNIDIILGDFNKIEWINELSYDEMIGYRDLVTNDMITYKPGQTTIDRILVRKGKFDNNIIFNGVTETFLSDRNLLSFSLNI